MLLSIVSAVGQLLLFDAGWTEAAVEEATTDGHHLHHEVNRRLNSCGSFGTNIDFEIDPIRIQAQDYCDMFGVQVEATQDVSGEENVGWIDENDWIAYDVHIAEAGTYGASYRVSNPMNHQGALQLEAYGTVTEDGILQVLSVLPSTSDWQDWATVDATSEEESFYLAAGWQTIAVKARAGGFNLNWFELIRLDRSFVPVPKACQVSIRQNARIEAEDFCTSSGVAVEPSSDTDGGWNVDSLDKGDWMAYRLQLPQVNDHLLAPAMILKLSYRISSPTGSGAFSVEFHDDLDVIKGEEASLLQTRRFVGASVDSFPPTSDWQTWSTVSHTLVLNGPLEEYLLYIRVLEGNWKLNWIEFEVLNQVTVPTAPIPSTPTASPPTPPVPVPTPSTGFVRSSGTIIVDGNGENLLLRGMGFGGWMLQEPYMMLTQDSAVAQHDMFANIEAIIGRERFETYHESWLNNYCTREDVAELKRSGFNSLRVALHYNLFTLPIEEEPSRGRDTWLQDGFRRLDSLLQWCKDNQVYLILDLHAAPGGQGRNAAINDYDDTKPSLWEEPENVRKTIALWVEFAERYRDETWIAAYDLLNEPNWNFEPGHPNGCTDTRNAPLKAFYEQAIEAIRQVDSNHMIVIEGNCWSNNHNGLWPLDDSNIVLSFHRYWIENTMLSIQPFLDYRDELSVPLWMGESGENNNVWYREAVNLLESQNIGWAWWSWKKMESDSGSFSIRTPSGYLSLLDYWAGRGPRPDSDAAFQTMMQLAENVKLENVVRNQDAIAALTSSNRNCDEADPVVVSIPGTNRLEAEEYCAMYGISSEESFDDSGGFNVGWIDPGDWLAFKVDIPETGSYVVNYRVSSLVGDGAFEIALIKETALGSIDQIPATGDWQNWITLSHVVSFSEGTQVVVVRAIEAGWNLNWLEIVFAE